LLIEILSEASVLNLKKDYFLDLINPICVERVSRCVHAQKMQRIRRISQRERERERWKVCSKERKRERQSERQ
jgi:hypothetical protein